MLAQDAQAMIVAAEPSDDKEHRQHSGDGQDDGDLEHGFRCGNSNLSQPEHKGKDSVGGSGSLIPLDVQIVLGLRDYRSLGARTIIVWEWKRPDVEARPLMNPVSIAIAAPPGK